MQMLRTFWDAALEPDEAAPDEGRVMRYRTEDELAGLRGRNGLAEVETTAIDVSDAYANFDDYWVPFTLVGGPGGAYCASLDPQRQQQLPDQLFPSTRFSGWTVHSRRSCLCRARPARERSYP
jgi:hypothetical protein